MRKSVKINYLLNLGYQLLLIALPLITTPYISRVLGDYAIGSYSFTQSVVTYFTLLGCIGLGLYGQREIAYCQNDFQKRTKLLYELVLLKLISVTVSFVLYFFVIQSVEKFQLLFYIQMIDLIANIFDINYFYQGLEDFSYQYRVCVFIGKITRGSAALCIDSVIVDFIRQYEYVAYTAEISCQIGSVFFRDQKAFASDACVVFAAGCRFGVYGIGSNDD